MSGSVINKSASDRVNLPDVHNAFFLNVNDHGTVHLHPLSEDTADPFWGPIALAPGEERPIEMVFAVPAEPIEQLSLRYLGDKGPFTIHLLGEAPSPLPTDSLASAPTPTGRTSQSNRGKGGVPPSARIKLDDVRVDKPPAESTIDTSGSNPSLKLRIQEALNRGGYGELIVVVRDDAVAVVIGVSKGDSLTARVSDLNSEFPKLSRVEPHLIAVPPSGAVHPKHLKDWANAAIKAAGLVEVEARMRKPDEVILLGHVKNQEEEETALSIARIGPGIKQVINRLNFQPSKKED